MVDLGVGTGILLDGKWNALSYLEKKEKKENVTAGKRRLNRSVVKKPATNQTLDDLFRMTKKRGELGYNTIVVWEHKFQNQYLLHKSQDMHTSIY